jgi:hypothetical protein
MEVEGQWSPHSKDFAWKGAFKQIPWSQLIVLAQSLGQKSPLPASSQAWVSAQVSWTHASDNSEKVEVSEGHIEGEFGDFVLGKVIAEKDLHKSTDGPFPWRVSPYKVLVKGVDLNVLTRMMGWQEPPSAFDSLGVFDGEAQFTENQLVSLAGQWIDLELIFSNRGLRENQRIKSIDLQLAGGANRWIGALSQIQLEDGRWDGSIQLVLDQNQKAVSVNSEFRDVKLDPDVEELMTLGGEVSPLEGRLNAYFENGQPSKIQGTLRAERALISEVSLEKVRSSFNSDGSVVTGDLQIQSVRWPQSQQIHWPPLVKGDRDDLQIRNLTGGFQRSAKFLKVVDLQGSFVDLRSRFQMQGGWNELGQLSGSLQVRGERTQQTFLLSGSRQSPQWTEKVR